MRKTLLLGLVLGGCAVEPEGMDLSNEGPTPDSQTEILEDCEGIAADRAKACELKGEGSECVEYEVEHYPWPVHRICDPDNGAVSCDDCRAEFAYQVGLRANGILSGANGGCGEVLEEMGCGNNDIDGEPVEGSD